MKGLKTKIAKKVALLMQIKAKSAIKKKKLEIAGLILNVRFYENISQKELGNRIGVTQDYVSKLESGKYLCSMRSLTELFDKLGYRLLIGYGKK